MFGIVGSNWRFDAPVVAACSLALGLYIAGVRRYERRRGRHWAARRGWAFGTAILSAIVAIESPLDAAGDARFAPHMVQHLILTDVTAPLLLLGGPLLLALSVAPGRIARGIVAALKSPLGRTLTHPVLTWTLFILTLWVSHYTGFFELALDSEPIHILEHAIYLGTALLFWLPIIPVGPTPWSESPLAYPLRMVYLLLAMPAEAMLGFTINGARHVLYPHYVVAGLADQRAAGEIMWVGGSACMFIAFMFVGFGWAEHEQRLGERSDRYGAKRAIDARQSSRS